MGGPIDSRVLTIDDLKDTERFECLGWVPWFDEHEQYDAAGKLVRNADLEWLESLCRNNNERITFSAFGPGHTVPHVRDERGQIVKASLEGDQPPHWGYLAEWSVKKLPDGTPAAGAVSYIKKRVELPTSKGIQILPGRQAVDSFPYRSIEYSPTKHDSPYGALLRRPAERDVGATVSFARGSETVVRGGVPLRCSTKRRARAAVQWGDRIYFSMEMNMADDIIPDPSAAPDAMAPSPEEMDKFKALMTACFPHLAAPPAAPPPLENNEAAAFPGANNMAIPAADKKKDEELDKFEREMLARFERKHGEDIKALKAENATIKAERRLDDAKARCVKLADDGIVFDSKRLIHRFERMDDAERDAEMEFIRSLRKTDGPPTDELNLGEPDRYERGPNGQPAPAAAERIERAKQLLRTKGYTGEAGWARALAETK